MIYFYKFLFYKFRKLFLVEQEVGANKMALNGIRAFALNDI